MGSGQSLSACYRTWKARGRPASRRTSSTVDVLALRHSLQWDGGDGGTMAKKDASSKRSAEEIIRAEEADPFEQPYWNLDQYLIWLASRDPAAVLRATDRPNSGTNPPSGWRMHRESNVDRQKVEMEAVQAIKGGHIKARVEFNGKWFTMHGHPPDNPEWFADWVIEFEGEPTFAALLMRTTTHGRREKYRPRFDPQSIVQRYRAPTLSNVCYRPDDPGVGRFIAYSDVWNWLAECISLQDTLPIDEAGSRAEKTIRDICMNTPEKLTMWGVRKADPDAELKSITPQAWQGQRLSINPLYDRATKGDGGPVIWTGLCFDRRQFVAAFVIGGGSEPPTHTPAARPAQPRERTPRKRLLRERAQRALSERYPSGVPDRASVSDAELVFAVNVRIEKNGQNTVSRETILRAAGRLK